MTDDLMTLLVQSGGQVAGMMFKMGITSLPTVLNVGSTLMSPALWIVPYAVLAAGSLVPALLAAGIIH